MNILFHSQLRFSELDLLKRYNLDTKYLNSVLKNFEENNLKAVFNVELKIFIFPIAIGNVKAEILRKS